MSKKKGGGGEACKWNQGAFPMFEKKSLIVWKFMENVTTSHLIYDLSKTISYIVYGRSHYFQLLFTTISK